jgi:glycerol-3-phosphate dehydrogenase
MSKDLHKDLKPLYDILVIGGGINGAGIALDAAMRGYSVLLVEKNDFGGSTTSNSTKLIHGGLRYLEYMEFPLVRESLREREHILQNAPHLIKPIKINFPFYGHSKRGPYLLKLGMILYDLLSYDKSMPNHSFMFNFNKKKLHDFIPTLRKEGLRGIATYYDCQALYPERLNLEIILSAHNEGADTMNHFAFNSMEWDGEKYSTIFTDTINDHQISVGAKFVVNATGPFVDNINKLVAPNIPRLMGGTKGSHILIDKFENGPEDGLYIEAIQDGRPFFILPWDEYYLVGTTDIFYNGDLDNIVATEDEVEYLLHELNYFTDSKEFTRDDVLYTYSGIRPLPYEPEKSESQVTRNHIIYDHEKKENIKNYISIVGGKLTTYRNLAEETIDVIEKKIGNKHKCLTKEYKLFGAKGIGELENFKRENAAHYSERYQIDEIIINYLIEFYGIRFIEVLKYIDSDSKLKERIDPERNDIKAQIFYAVEVEKAKTLEDIIIRRTSLGTHGTLGYHTVEDIAEIAAPLLNMNENEKVQAIEDYKEKVKNHYKLNEKFIEKGTENYVTH